MSAKPIKLPAIETLTARIGDIEVDHSLNSRMLKNKMKKSYSDGEKPSEEHTTVEGLAASIKRDGMLQAVVVTKNEKPGAKKPWLLAAGFRRMEAITRILGCDADTVISIRVISPKEPHDIAVANLVENLQREDLHAAEMAMGFVRLRDEGGLSGKQIAARVGVSQSHVNNLLRLHDGLSPRVWAAFATGTSEKTLRFLLTEVLPLPTHKEQEDLFFNQGGSDDAGADGGEGGDGNGAGGASGRKSRPNVKTLEKALKVAREDRRKAEEEGDGTRVHFLTGVVRALAWAAGEDNAPCPVALEETAATEAPDAATA